MSRKTWQDLARQQKKANLQTAPVPAAPVEIDAVAEQVPALQTLLAKRKALEAHMQSLGGGAHPESSGADPRFPVASMAERRAELDRWARQHEQRKPAPVQTLDNRPRTAPRDPWQQLRDSQTGHAVERARGVLAQQQSVMQRLDQRVNDARNKARQRIASSRDKHLQAPLAKPLDHPLTERLDAPMQPTRTERATTRDDFDQRYQQRVNKLLGVGSGSTDDLAARRDRQREAHRERLREQRLEARKAERQAERQDMMKRERAQERRAQRPLSSTD